MNSFNSRPPFKGQTDLYILDGAGNPVPEPDVLKWAQWFETANRRVGYDIVDEYSVSTVFIGIDHGFGRFFNQKKHTPVLWETMIFYRPEEMVPRLRQRAAELAKSLECPQCGKKLIFSTTELVCPTNMPYQGCGWRGPHSFVPDAREEPDPFGLDNLERYTSLKDAEEGHQATIKMIKRRHFRRVANGDE